MLVIVILGAFAWATLHPLSAVLLAPAFFGGAHLCASIGLSPRVSGAEPVSAQRAFFFVLSAASLAAVTWFPSFRLGGLDGPTLVALLALLLAAAFYGRFPFEAGALLLPSLAFVMLATALAPGHVFAWLAFGHSAVAFVFWIMAARPGHRKQALATSAVAFGLAMLLACGLAGSVAAGEAAARLAGSLAPWAEGEARRGWLQAYAFGQLMHYTIWLGFLPGALGSSGAVPIREIFRGWGRATAAAGLAACGLVGFLWLAMEAEAARGLYLALATPHVFFEVGCLLRRLCISVTPGLEGGACREVR